MTALFINKCVSTKAVTLASSESGIMLSSILFLLVRSNVFFQNASQPNKTSVYQVSFNNQLKFFFLNLHSLTVQIFVILS